jgi:hypothetical protein
MQMTVEPGGKLSRAPRRTLVAIVCALVIGSGACSSSHDKNRNAAPVAITTTTEQDRPAGPSADLSHEITGGNGAFMSQELSTNLPDLGYVEREYVASGTVSSYRATSPPGHDGRWRFVSDGSAPYRTRVLVRRPADPTRFSGTVVVEWLNVSGGVDTDPEWNSLREEIARRGDAWVGVSAQRVGVVGGPILLAGAQGAGKGLRAIDPARYGSLQHPGDGFSYDIFTQVARAIRSGAGLGVLKPQRLIAAGESQSAFALVTYYNGVQRLTNAFDGFFVHSRGAVALPLAAPGKYADIANSLKGTPTIFRTDLNAPVLDVQTETDVASVLDSYAARQPDSTHFRLWEVAGTAHADAHLVGSVAKDIKCGGLPINNGPMHIVAKAALHALTTWLTTGQAAPTAPRIDVTPGATPKIERNPYGIALGGIRTPPVDVPVAALSGATPDPNPSTICLLLGSTKPFSAARLSHLYPSRAAYLQRYDADADATIKAGFALPEDRAALMAFAEPSRIPN